MTLTLLGNVETGCVINFSSQILNLIALMNYPRVVTFARARVCIYYFFKKKYSNYFIIYLFLYLSFIYLKK
jgi:hypothetical protein